MYWLSRKWLSTSAKFPLIYFKKKTESKGLKKIKSGKKLPPLKFEQV